MAGGEDYLAADSLLEVVSCCEATKCKNRQKEPHERRDGAIL